MLDQHENIFGKKFLEDSMSGAEFTKHLTANRSRLMTIAGSWQNLLDQGLKDEESFQDRFTNEIFRNLLGYTHIGESMPWTCTREYKILGGKSVDLAIGFYEKGESENKSTYAVAEFKSPAYRDLSRKSPTQGMSPVDQAFNYAQRIGIHQCHWIIVSNMDEIRLYNTSSMEKFESFRIAEIAKNTLEFDRFYLLLSRQNLLPEKPSEKSLIDTLYDKNQADLATINKKFYDKYSKSRQTLFEHLTEDNPNIDRLSLLEKVQKILDRFLFMCFCQGKGYFGKTITKLMFENAMNSFTGSVWNEFIGISNAIDKGSEKPIKIPPYNGGLFSKDPDLEKINVKDEAFESLKALDDNDYQSDLDVNILGHVFEQSVSDIEELKASINNEEFDKKKGKRKKQGIYYTPAYITGFIIEQTIGAWIEREKDKLCFDQLPLITEVEENLLTESEINKKDELPNALKEKAKAHGTAWTKLQENLLGIKVLDPACGSGAFLNKAFQYLVKQHTEIFKERKHFGASDDLGGFDITQVDYHIAKHNLYGVDLSKESVEITKLSLWLQLVYHKEKLPSLEHSIHFGDSIVSDPNYSKAAFDWQATFENIVKFDPETCNQKLDHGFDIVIGNPPYVRQEFLSPVKPALQNIYGDFFNGVADLYTYFYKRGFQLLKHDGYLGFITSSTFTKTGSGRQTREWLQNNVTINSFVDFGILQLWEGDAANLVCIFVGQNKTPAPEQAIKAFKVTSVPEKDTEKPFENIDPVLVQQASLGADAWNFDRPEVEALRNKIFSKGRPLKEIVPAIYRGILTGLNEAFIIDKATKDRLIKEDSKSTELIKPFLVGRDLKQWHYDFSDRYLIFTRRGVDIDKYQAIKKHLEQFRERLEPRPENLSEDEKRNWKGRKPGPYKWFEIQDNIAYYKAFEEPKIVYGEITIKPRFSIVESGIYTEATTFIIRDGCEWLITFMNSPLIWFCLTKISPSLLGNAFRFKKQWTEPLPIVEPQGSEDDPTTDKGRLASLAKTAQEKAFKRLEYRKGFLSYINDLLNHKSQESVDDDDVSEGSAINRWDTLSWNDFLKAASSPSAFGKRFSEVYKQVQTNMALKKSFDELVPVCQQLTREIHECERQINEIVYRLYELTPDEIKLLEELTGNIYED